MFEVITLETDFRKGEFLWAGDTGVVWREKQNKKRERCVFMCCQKYPFKMNMASANGQNPLLAILQSNESPTLVHHH